MKISNTPYYASSIFLATALAASPLVADQNPNVQGADRAGTGQGAEPARGLQGTSTTAADRSDKTDRSGGTDRSDRTSSVEVDDIVGKDVVNLSDDNIGNVDKIVRHQQSQDLHAVVSVGGFLGMGQKEVTIPLKELRVTDEGIRAPQTANTEDQLKALPQYDQSMYQEVDGDYQLNRAEFAAFESDQQADRAGLQGTRTTAAAGSDRTDRSARTDRSERANHVEVDDVVGKNVINQSEDNIGNVEKIVRHQQSQDLHAVVSVGGFLGMGQREVTIPLKDLQVTEDGIRAPQTAHTEDQLKALPQYDQSLYQEVDGDYQIERADFAAFESDDN